MRVLKRILFYCIWTVIAFLFAFGYLCIILGFIPNFASDFTSFFDLFIKIAFIYVVPLLGSIIAFVFILMDVFYLNKKLKNSANATSIRLLFVIGLTILLGTTHYILEKVVDVI